MMFIKHMLKLSPHVLKEMDTKLNHYSHANDQHKQLKLLTAEFSCELVTLCFLSYYWFKIWRVGMRTKVRSDVSCDSVY